MLTFIDLIIALMYLGGYGLVAILSFMNGHDHCWAYLVLTVAAVGHVVLILIRWFRREKKDRWRPWRRLALDLRRLLTAARPMRLFRSWRI